MSAERVAVVDDHVLFAEASSSPWSTGGTTRGASIRRATPRPRPRSSRRCSAGNPDVVLLDLDLGQAGDGLDLIVRLSDPLTRRRR